MSHGPGPRVLKRLVIFVLTLTRTVSGRKRAKTDSKDAWHPKLRVLQSRRSRPTAWGRNSDIACHIESELIHFNVLAALLLGTRFHASRLHRASRSGCLPELPARYCIDAGHAQWANAFRLVYRHRSLERLGLDNRQCHQRVAIRSPPLPAPPALSTSRASLAFAISYCRRCSR